MYKESPIRHGGKSEKEGERPKRVRFAAQTTDNQYKSSPVKIPSEDSSQVGGGSETRTTGKKYYLEHLTVPPNSLDRGSTETSPKDKARIGLIDERNVKRPIKRPETPQKQDKSSLIKVPTRNRRIGGSWTTSTDQKYYLRNLAVPPNSPETGSAEMTFKGKTRVDVMDKRNWKPPVECPGKANDNDQQDLLLTKDGWKEEDNFKDEEALPIKEDSGKKENVDDQQELPTKNDLGKKKSVKKSRNYQPMKIKERRVIPEETNS
ncbi:hypothetical protein N7463_006912 [Penicillium fimorum]|uniref:Uncharacterized protein n=1 Tax=Penicillium fimorum TaxID=1882269 RepID=A0A9W9XVB8_9EURO|nr:hypothetical protein N7463_006912 [Penicillium fimorum]